MDAAEEIRKLREGKRAKKNCLLKEYCLGSGNKILYRCCGACLVRCDRRLQAQDSNSRSRSATGRSGANRKHHRFPFRGHRG